MLHLIPPPIHRLALRMVHGLRKQWWRLARPEVIGCRVLAFDGEDRLLLIRHSYGNQSWMAPGGGMHRGEDPLIAAEREFSEELGCPLDDAVLLGVVTEDLHGARNVVHVVAGTVGGTPRPDGREVIDTAAFSARDLPENMPRLLRATMQDWVTAAKAARHSGEAPGLARPPAPIA